MKSGENPLEHDELTKLFAGTARLPASVSNVVVAVSGGPDSMALMAALARWQAGDETPRRIIVATVDHGLRPESEAECALVRREAEQLGLEFRLLRWEGEKPSTGLQEKAREARYRLLLELCRQERACLFTAHTRDDQAETIMMRLARGSGLSGMSGMSGVQIIDHVWFLRPFLDVPKARLVASCRHWDIPFIEDPSNSSDTFTRVRWRKLLPALAAEGLDASRLAVFARRIARADEALEDKASQALTEARQTPADAIPARLNGLALHSAEPDEILVRVYARMLGTVSGRSAPMMRLNRLEDCVKSFNDAILRGKPLRRTLAGTIISLDKNGILTFAPEPPRQRGRPKELC